MTPDATRRLNSPSTTFVPLQRIYSEWQKLCLKTCDDELRLFWICRQEQGVLTPFKCQEENRGMHECLNVCSADEQGFTAYRTKRLDQIEALALGKLEAVKVTPTAPVGSTPSPSTSSGSR